MAWEWLIAFDGVLGLGVAALAVYFAWTARGNVLGQLFAVVCLMATIRIFYFIILALFDVTPAAGLAGMMPATENVLGIALVGTALALHRQGWRGFGRGGPMLAVYVLGLFPILLLFQPNPAAGPLPYFAPFFLGTIFVTATVVTSILWLQDQAILDRPRLGWILAALFSWSLNDGIRIGHAAWAVPDSQRTGVHVFTLVVAAVWLAALAAVAFAVLRDIWIRGARPSDNVLLGLLGAGVVLSLLQMLTSDPNGMRAVHLVLDCSAILLIGATLIRSFGIGTPKTASRRSSASG
jgi:hypothetical protein